MSTPFKMSPGRGAFEKTGRNVPASFCSPLEQTKRQRKAFAQQVADAHNSGANVNAESYDSNSWKTGSKKDYLVRPTKGYKKGQSWRANELSEAALLNFKDGLALSRDSISGEQVYDILKKNKTFNSNTYTADPNQNYQFRNDAFDKITGETEESPIKQKRKDAITGEVIPDDAVFSETTSTPKNSAVTIHTRDWNTSSTQGTTPKSKPKMPDAEWRALVERRKEKGLPPINPNPTPTGTTTPGTSGTRGRSGKQTWKTYHAEMIPMRPIQPMSSFDDDLVPTKLPRRKGDVPFKPIGGNIGGEETSFGGVKKVLNPFSPQFLERAKNILPSIKKACNGGLAGQ